MSLRFVDVRSNYTGRNAAMLRWRFVVGGEKLQIPFDFAQGRLSAALGMTKGRAKLPSAFDTD